MPNKRENFSIVPESDVRKLADVGINVRGYDIGGNQFRAYYDADNTLIFVVDGTISERKPNVLLVMGGGDDRKWDEILVSDWDVDLETIRPKKDNKYQKLDIEYGGLMGYELLIRAYVNNEGLDAPLARLNAWRDGVVRRLTLERLAGADATAARANDTVTKTNDTITELQEKLTALRERLTQERRSVGREPTKQSAAKILRTESQIEATNEKMARAKKRLSNAGRRLVSAEDDARNARELLKLLAADNNQATVMVENQPNIVAPVVVQPVVTVPAVTEITEEKPKAEDMADEVKPLFDKDPNILDEEIAFKPIDFSAKTEDVMPVQDNQPATNNVSAPAPLSFTPPTSTTNDFGPIADVPSMQSVLDTMRPVVAEQSTPVEPYVENANHIAPESNPVGTVEFTVAGSPAVSDVYGNNNVAPEYPTSPVVNNVNNVPPRPAPAPMPGVADAPNNSGFRPVSPIRGNNVESVDVRPAAKSKLLYYVLLVLLIVLSVFALWQYQKSTVDNVPELATTASGNQSTDKNEPTQADGANCPFLGIAGKKTENKEPAEKKDEPVATVNETVPAVSGTGNELEVEIYANPLPAPEEVVTDNNGGTASDVDAIVVEPLPVAEPAQPATDNNDVVVESPFLAPAPVEETPKQPVVVDKPAYNVSQNEKMFVADPEYESDNVPAVEPEPEPIAEIAEDDSVQVCSDGSMPDGNGCCGGEVYTDMEDGTFACCQPGAGGECFEPIQF